MYDLITLAGHEASHAAAGWLSRVFRVSPSLNTGPNGQAGWTRYQLRSDPDKRPSTREMQAKAVAILAALLLHPGRTPTSSTDWQAIEAIERLLPGDEQIGFYRRLMAETKNAIRTPEFRRLYALIASELERHGELDFDAVDRLGPGR